MAEDPKSSPTPSASPAPTETNISPGLGDVVAETKNTPGAPGAPGAASAPPTKTNLPSADALADGTKPTILTPGAVRHNAPTGKTSLSEVYRRADITTTLLTFVGAVVAAGLIFGVYAFLASRGKSPTSTKPTKVTQLDKSELEKLDAFFSGNTAGKSSQILTISSSSLFKERVAVGSDLKVVGGLQVSGPSSLADLSVDKTSTLGVTNIRGSLTVSGPFSTQGANTLGGATTIKGDLSATGNGSFGGSLSAGTLNIRDLSVAGTLNLAGHLAIGGQAPTVSVGSESGTGATASIDGNDAAGTVTINTGTIPSHAINSGGLLVTINFRSPYARVPRVVISPIGAAAAAVQPYIIKTSGNFTIGGALDAKSHTSYSFDYWIVQ